MSIYIIKIKNNILGIYDKLSVSMDFVFNLYL